MWKLLENGALVASKIELPHYPRTLHLVNSKGLLQSDQIPLEVLTDQFVVVEEKVDGSCVSIHFDSEATLHLYHRHTEARGPEFARLRAWLAKVEGDLFDILTDRYILYGEWLYAKHTIYYDQLPHYFLEYDIYDRLAQCFLATAERYQLLTGQEEIVSVRIVPSSDTLLDHPGGLECLLRQESAYRSADCISNLMAKYGASVLNHTLSTPLMEGLYLKIENSGRVQCRFKLINELFFQKLMSSGDHWRDREILPNISRQVVGILC